MDKVDTHRGLLTEASDAIEPSVYEPLEKPLAMELANTDKKNEV